MTECQRPGNLKDRNLSPHSSGEVHSHGAGRVGFFGGLSPLLVDGSLLSYFHTVFPLYTSVSKFAILTRTPLLLD